MLMLIRKIKFYNTRESKILWYMYDPIKGR